MQQSVFLLLCHFGVFFEEHGILILIIIIVEAEIVKQWVSQRRIKALFTKWNRVKYLALFRDLFELVRLHDFQMHVAFHMQSSQLALHRYHQSTLAARKGMIDDFDIFRPSSTFSLASLWLHMIADVDEGDVYLAKWTYSSARNWMINNNWGVRLFYGVHAWKKFK
jgi:hypothetical protein